MERVYVALNCLHVGCDVSMFGPQLSKSFTFIWDINSRYKTPPMVDIRLYALQYNPITWFAYNFRGPYLDKTVY